MARTTSALKRTIKTSSSEGEVGNDLEFNLPLLPLVAPTFNPLNRFLSPEIPKPEIKSLFAIDGRTVLVQWAHVPKDGGEVQYQVSWGPEPNSVEVEENDDKFAIIQGFEPERAYNFTVTIHIEFFNKVFSSTSDPVSLRMPWPSEYLRTQPSAFL